MSAGGKRRGGRSMLARLFAPAVLLVLLPPLSCLVFHASAMRYAYDEASRELSSLQQQIEPLLESWSAKDLEAGTSSDAGSSHDEGVSGFLKSAGSAASQLGGNARLLILSDTLKMVYPRNEQLREQTSPLAADFASYLGKVGAGEGSPVTISASDGETYLAALYDPPSSAGHLGWVIVYCPTSHIGEWVGASSLLVLGISSAFSALALVALAATARSITRPLKRLCRESERIGGGDFAEIEPAFKLGELEDLRRSMNGMSRRLERAEQSQKRFLSNVSHELRSPLMSIGGYAQGIEQGVFDPPQHAARVIMGESARLTEVVEGLLSLSRLEGESRPADLRQVDLVAATRRCVERARGFASARDVSVRVCAPEEEVAALATEELLGSVLDNVLSNAVRYAESEVCASVLVKGDSASVEVSDDGPGISADDLPHVFERCYKGEGGHAGLGLAIAQSAAGRMDATLAAGKGPMGGASFTLTLHRA